MQILLEGILVLKHTINKAQRSLNLSIRPDSKLVYHTRANLWKVAGRILHIESLFWMANSKLPCTFYTFYLGSVRPS
jgi:hypothetical protein